MRHSLRPLDFHASPPVGSKCAYVTFLLTTPSYLPGILVLAHSLEKVKSSYPLIVAINPTLPDEARQVLESYGLNTILVQPLLPVGRVTTIAERFVDTWTKVAVFDLVDYDVSVISLMVVKQ